MKTQPTEAPTGFHEARLLTPDQLCELLPGMTTTKLAQQRYAGTGPRYYKPTERTVIYSLADVMAWLESTARTATFDENEVA